MATRRWINIYCWQGIPCKAEYRYTHAIEFLPGARGRANFLVKIVIEARLLIKKAISIEMALLLTS
ncbi:MAG: hypothetical protein ACJA13_003154 [Paraglaciecola sp.]|jgi:hypothetical protein